MERSDVRKRRTAAPDERRVSTSVSWLDEVAEAHEALAASHRRLADEVVGTAVEHEKLAANIRGFINGALSERDASD